MTELTKEFLEQALKELATKDDIKGLATKGDLKPLATSEQIEELARMVSAGFEDIQSRLDIQKLIQAHERKFKKLEEALHITL